MGMIAAFTYPSIQQQKFFLRESAFKTNGRTRNSKARDQKARRASISTLSDMELLKNVRQMRGTEKRIEVSMLLHLIEVERRGLDLSGGYNSLFAFCTKHLKYSDSVAGRRIRAARCMREFPAVYEYLSAGKVNVCNISQVAGIMTEKNHLSLLAQISGRSLRYVEALVSGHKPAIMIRDLVTPVKVFEKEFVKEPGGGQKLITSAGDKESCTSFALSTGEGSLGEGGEGELRGKGSESESKGSVRVVEKQKFKLRFAVSPEFMKKYERIKELMSTKHPGGIKFEEAFEALMDEYIEKHSPEARVKRREARAAKKKMESVAKVEKAKKVKSAVKVKRAAKTARTEQASLAANESCKVLKEKELANSALSSPPPQKGSEEPSRFIPQAIKDQVFKRDGGKCEYRGPDGRRCGSKWNIQVDHITPFALGGSNSPENLQLLCRRHNQHKALKDFGKKKMRKHVEKK